MIQMQRRHSLYEMPAGLFHFAILVLNRKNLALTYLVVKNSGIQYDGFADHLVSESLYLRDPEDNGIEIYCDRPVNEWPRNFEGCIIMDTLPLELNSLLSDITTEEIKDKSGRVFPDGAKIGHVHLRVTNPERCIRFYHQKGLEICWSIPFCRLISSPYWYEYLD